MTLAVANIKFSSISLNFCITFLIKKNVSWLFYIFFFCYPANNFWAVQHLATGTQTSTFCCNALEAVGELEALKFLPPTPNPRSRYKKAAAAAKRSMSTLRRNGSNSKNNIFWVFFASDWMFLIWFCWNKTS